MSEGNKEILDCWTVVDELAKAITKAKEDGSVNVLDLRYLPPVIASLRDAVEGSKDIAEEASHLSKEDLQEVLSVGIQAAMNLVSSIVK